MLLVIPYEWVDNSLGVVSENLLNHKRYKTLKLRAVRNGSSFLSRDFFIFFVKLRLTVFDFVLCQISHTPRLKCSTAVILSVSGY